MKISLAIHFPLCLPRHFRLFFSTLNKFLNIFDVFFDPRYAQISFCSHKVVGHLGKNRLVQSVLSFNKLTLRRLLRTQVAVGNGS